MKIGAVLVLAAGLSGTGCGGSGGRSVAGPTQVTPNGQMARPVSSLSGFVLDSGFRPLAGARVEAIDGASPGASASADANGQFTVSGTFISTDRFRASKDGYVAATQPWNCSAGTSCSTGGANPWLGFYLAPLTPSVNIVGDYTLTFTADPACTGLPGDARKRTYPVTIAPAAHLTSPGVHLTAGNGSFLSSPWRGPLNGFDIGVAGDYLRFSLGDGEDPTLVERLGPSTYLAFSGSASASVGTPPASTISTSFDGWIEYCVTATPMSPDDGYYCVGAVMNARCESKAHALTLTRR